MRGYASDAPPGLVHTGLAAQLELAALGRLGTQLQGSCGCRPRLCSRLPPPPERHRLPLRRLHLASELLQLLPAVRIDTRGRAGVCACARTGR